MSDLLMRGRVLQLLACPARFQDTPQGYGVRA